MQAPLVISFFTAGTPYELEAQRLRQSCTELNIEHVIDAQPSGGTWARNCAMKGPFVCAQLEQLRRPVLWIDADATVMRPLDCLAELRCDLACYVRWPAPNQPPGLDSSYMPFMSGTVYFAFSPGGRRAAQLWATYCRAYSTLLDQECLALAWWDLRRELSFHLLPQGFCKVFDQAWLESSHDTYILHHQASRRLGRLV